MLGKHQESGDKRLAKPPRCSLPIACSRKRYSPEGPAHVYPFFVYATTSADKSLPLKATHAAETQELHQSPYRADPRIHPQNFQHARDTGPANLLALPHGATIQPFSAVRAIALPDKPKTRDVRKSECIGGPRKKELNFEYAQGRRKASISVPRGRATPVRPIVVSSFHLPNISRKGSQALRFSRFH